MITSEVRREYRRIRSQGDRGGWVGYSATSALSDARVSVAWRALEDAGLVRIRVEPDPDADWSWLDQDCFAHDRANMIRRIDECGGAFGTIAEYRASDGDEWEEAASCWGHMGYDDPADPDENPYVLDHMRSTLDALRDALRSRFCPKCGARRAA